MTDVRLKISPPWITYVNQLSVLFGEDPEITIEYNNDIYRVELFVDNEDKAEALSRLLPIEKVEDETFSQKLLGDGVAIEPVDGLVSAPAAGKIVTVMEDSKHALGIELANGTEILIHAGLDTVDMKGEGFEMLVSEGDSVKKGTPLLKFDLDKVAKAGHKKTVVLVVTDAKDRILKKFATGENVKAGESCILQI